TPMLAIALLAGVAAKLVVGERLLATRRGVHIGLPLTLSRLRAPVLISLTLMLATFVVMPLVVLALEVGRVERITTALKASGQAITNSLVLAGIGAICIVAIAVLLGYGRGRARTRFGGLVDLALIVIFAVPSTVVGVGLIGLWNR